MAKRPVRLGIDYGTCHSKIVFRDLTAAGREKAYAVLYDRHYLIPSAVQYDDSHLVFGRRPQVVRPENENWTESLKMRVADEADGSANHYYFGPSNPLPPGFSAKDLAILTVWFLLSEGAKAVRNTLKVEADEVALEFILGIPMSFYDVEKLRTAFLDIARTAREIYVKAGEIEDDTIELQFARELLDTAKSSVEQIGAIPDGYIRDWLRTEAAAALQWSAMSPGVAIGPYAQIDIGAGTTHVSLFRIATDYNDGGKAKDRLPFFGAESIALGMDAIDQSIAEFDEITTNFLSLRGNERAHLQINADKKKVEGVLKKIHESYRKTLATALRDRLQAPDERIQWRQHKIFFIGGGSSIKVIVDELRRYPLAGFDQQLEIIGQDIPPDFKLMDGSRISGNELAFLSVAYGLTCDDDLTVETPINVPAMQVPDGPPRYRPLLERDEWRG